MRNILFLLISLSLSSPSWARNPNGKFGGSQEQSSWQDSWTDAFMDCWNRDSGGATGKALEKAFAKNLNDFGYGKEWCPSGAPEDASQAKLVMLATFKSLAKAESSWNPGLVDPNGVNEPAIGLLQIGVEDAQKKHNCTTVTGKRINSVSELQNPHNNICCALKIAANVSQGVTGSGEKVAGAERNTATFATGKNGFLARFWEPMRPGKKRSEIVRNVNAACKQIETAGYSSEGPLNATDFQKASGSTVAETSRNIQTASAE